MGLVGVSVVGRKRTAARPKRDGDFLLRLAIGVVFDVDGDHRRSLVRIDGNVLNPSLHRRSVEVGVCRARQSRGQRRRDRSNGANCNLKLNTIDLPHNAIARDARVGIYGFGSGR